MAKLRKAARGKRRWLGLSVDESITNREDLISHLETLSCLGERWRLYDFKDGFAIVRVGLPYYQLVRENLESDSSLLKSISSSGKIKLVRERLGLTK